MNTISEYRIAKRSGSTPIKFEVDIERGYYMEAFRRDLNVEYDTYSFREGSPTYYYQITHRYTDIDNRFVCIEDMR